MAIGMTTSATQVTITGGISTLPAGLSGTATIKTGHNEQSLSGTAMVIVTPTASKTFYLQSIQLGTGNGSGHIQLTDNGVVKCDFNNYFTTNMMNIIFPTPIPFTTNLSVYATSNAGEVQASAQGFEI